MGYRPHADTHMRIDTNTHAHARRACLALHAHTDTRAHSSIHTNTRWAHTRLEGVLKKHGLGACTRINTHTGAYEPMS